MKKYHSYTPIKKIGHGNFGEVELVRSQADQQLYIIKVGGHPMLETTHR